jgi:hypothetical protein
MDPRERRGRAFPERPDDSHFRSFGSVELRRPVQEMGATTCAAMARATARRKGRPPMSFAFSSGKRPQSPGKSGRTISRRTMRNPWKSRCFRCRAARLKIVVSRVRVPPSPRRSPIASHTCPVQPACVRRRLHGPRRVAARIRPGAPSDQRPPPGPSSQAPVIQPARLLRHQRPRYACLSWCLSWWTARAGDT